MKREYKAIVIGVSMIASYMIQTFGVFTYLEKIGVWPPAPFTLVIVCLITFVGLVLLIVLISKAEREKKVGLTVFLAGCAVLLIPWFINSYHLLLENLLGRH